MKKLLVLVMFILLTGCQKQAIVEDNFFAYNTLISVRLYEGTSEDLKNIKKIFNDFHQLADFNNAYTDIKNIYTINNSAYENPIVISDELYEMIKLGLDYYDYTNGYFNIAIGSASFIWKEAIDNQEVIDLTPQLNNTNINDIILNDENKTIKINNEHLKIDLGGMAKGYALLRVKEYLNDTGITRYLINAGESSIIVGVKNKNDNYKIGLKDPIDNNETFSIIEEKNKALSVSGDYQNYFDLENIRYHHIINPLDLTINRDYHSITLIGEDPFLLDVLSTALFSMAYTDAVAIVEKAHIKAIFYVTNTDIRTVDYEEN